MTNLHYLEYLMEVLNSATVVFGSYIIVRQHGTEMWYLFDAEPRDPKIVLWTQNIEAALQFESELEADDIIDRYLKKDRDIKIVKLEKEKL